MNKVLKGLSGAITLLSFMLSFVNLVEASERENGVLLYNIPVVSEAGRFIDILEYPTYVAIALQNNGIRVAELYEVKIGNYRNFAIKGTEFNFIKRDGGNFYYQVQLGRNIASRMLLPMVDVAVNTSELSNGIVVFRVASPIVNVLPESVKDIIKGKINDLASVDNQKKVLKYFEKLSNSGFRDNEIQNIVDGIMVDAYNAHVNESGIIYMEGIVPSPMYQYSTLIYIVTAFIIIIPIFMLQRASIVRAAQKRKDVRKNGTV